MPSATIDTLAPVKTDIIPPEDYQAKPFHGVPTLKRHGMSECKAYKGSGNPYRCGILKTKTKLYI